MPVPARLLRRIGQIMPTRGGCAADKAGHFLVQDPAEPLLATGCSGCWRLLWAQKETGQVNTNAQSPVKHLATVPEDTETEC